MPGIFDPQPTPELTIEQQKAQLISEVARVNRNALLTTVALVQQCFGLVWNNNNLTPQEVFDGFGTNAKDLVSSFQAYCVAIASIDPSIVLPQPPNNLTVNDDGTVTVGDPIVPPTPPAPDEPTP